MSGFICVSIDKAIKQILRNVNSAVRCQDELKPLKELVTSMEATMKQIQRYRLLITWKKDGESDVWVKKVNIWLDQLDKHLQNASTETQNCAVSTRQGILCDHLSKKITDSTSEIAKHLQSMSSLVDDARAKGIVADARHISPAWQTVTPSSGVRDILAPSTTSATSQTALYMMLPTEKMDKQQKALQRMKLMDEALIVGQQKYLERLEKLVTNEELPTTKKIGVLGKGGSGKTLLLKNLFNSKKVRNHFNGGFMLWLTVSQSPCFTSLRNKLWTQIKIQDKKGAVKNINEQHVEIWIAIQNNVDAIKYTEEPQVIDEVNKTLQLNSSFVLFLDDVWENNAQELLEQLGILQSVIDNPHSKVIVSSWDENALKNMEIADEDVVNMKGLNEHDSWELFFHHAFPAGNRNPPGKEEGKLVCQMCQGLPLAIKVVGKAMAGSTDRKQWRWALQRLSNSKSVCDCRLGFGFEALANEGVKMQCCFLLVAATSLEDEILFARHVIVLWAGEGLLSGKVVQEEGYDLFEMGWNYLTLLADRYLIEPMMRDHDGRVVCFRIHDQLRNLAIQIAQKQENFYYSVGKNSTVLKASECSSSTRIFLSHNESLGKSLDESLGQSLDPPLDFSKFCSLSISENRVLEKIPGKVLVRMCSLKFLDLSWTRVLSLPKTLGELKQLVCLRVMGVPIKTLPESLTALVNLEILDLSFSSITELPSGLNKLKSLRYLGLSHCKYLQYLPHSILALTSLQYLHMIECKNLWTNAGRRKCKKVARISDLGKLSKVKWLELQNNGETFDDQLLGKMAEVETLRLTLTTVKILPSSISEMSKLKRLALKCPDVDNMELSHVRNKKFDDYFQNLNCLVLFKCDKLVTLPDFHKLRNLQRLEIITCRKLRKLPEAFGEAGEFSSLKIFSLVRLEKLVKLPEIKDGAMPSLQIFTIMECPVLEGLPRDDYLKLKTLQKFRIYSCPKVAKAFENWEEVTEPNMNKMVKLMSIRETEEIKKWHFQLCVKHGSWVYGELWCSELFLFLGGLDTLV